jgi:dolichol kinase
MPKQLRPPQPISHAQSLREGVVRRLSRSPHPYHRRQYELPYASERFISNAPPKKSPLRSAQNTDDEDHEEHERGPEEYRESTNSDSGTEADDEHFLKGLPAPKLRPHKGLRGADSFLSGTPSPMLSPAILDQDIQKHLGSSRTSRASEALKEEDVLKVLQKFRRKRRVEIVRRMTEGSLMVFVGVVLCRHREVRELWYLWRKGMLEPIATKPKLINTELCCQLLVVMSLLAAYPIRLLRGAKSDRARRIFFPLILPSSFDPAPLLYPPAITLLVSTLLSLKNPTGFLPSIILSISSLPKQLIPSVGGLEGSNTFHWALSSLPLLFLDIKKTAIIDRREHARHFELDPQVLILVAPLHQALCVTLQYLTTTSLLPAESQLLSIGLINLLILASSPQAVILKALLWGGGVGILVNCEPVLRWGVALARVPKWRFRRPGIPAKSLNGRGMKLAQKALSVGKLSTSIFGGDTAVTDSSEEDGLQEPLIKQRTSQKLKISTENTFVERNATIDNGSTFAVAYASGDSSALANGFTLNQSNSSLAQRRHTLPAVTQLPARSNQRTPSGRKKRSASSSVRSFFNLTQSQATARKWLYAGYVYASVAILILVCIRDYVQRYALHGNEPVGWALGYLLGDIQWFRMEVVTSNLQRWVCLPPRSGLENEESCHMGWVEHLRHASFGEANTRLILCGYWLAIIIVGLAVVFRLSSIYEVDTRRKVFHFMMVAMLLPATYVDPTFAALALSLMLAIFLLLDLFRASQLPPLSQYIAYFLTPYVDGRDLKGPVVISHIFLLIGCAIPLWLSLGCLPRTGTAYLSGWEIPTREVSMISGVICVGMGDAAASLIGRRYGRHKWLWGGGKSIEGSIAFATAVGLALVLAKAWLRIGGWPANNEDPWITTVGKSGVAAGIASLTEAVLTGGNDNVVVPIVLWLCVKGLDI